MTTKFQRQFKIMKKFEIKKKSQNKWLVIHHEFPKYTCEFENHKFNEKRKIEGLSNMYDLKEIFIFKQMEEWLVKNHIDKL